MLLLRILDAFLSLHFFDKDLRLSEYELKRTCADYGRFQIDLESCLSEFLSAQGIQGQLGSL